MGIAEKSLGILSVVLTLPNKWERGVERERRGRWERLTVSHTREIITVLTPEVWLGVVMWRFETAPPENLHFISPVGVLVSWRGFSVYRTDPFQRTQVW